MNYITIKLNFITTKCLCDITFELYKSLKFIIMKSIILGVSVLLFSLNSFAQNQNSKTEVKTTVTTVKDSDGQKQVIKTEEVKEVQNIELKEAQPNTLNIEMKDSPVEVTAVTKVKENGITKIVDVDHSAYYSLNGQKYQISSDNSGYTMTIPNRTRTATLRRTSNNNYIYRNRGKVSFGYFDANGNLILETYDEKTDKITVEKFDIQK